MNYRSLESQGLSPEVSSAPRPFGLKAASPFTPSRNRGTRSTVVTVEALLASTVLPTTVLRLFFLQPFTPSRNRGTRSTVGSVDQLSLTDVRTRDPQAVYLQVPFTLSPLSGPLSHRCPALSLVRVCVYVCFQRGPGISPGSDPGDVPQSTSPT